MVDSLMFDVTSRPESQHELFKIIATQFPNRWGEPSRIIEIHFLKSIDKDYAITTGLVFTDTNKRIIPTRALNRESKVVRLHLTDLPFLSEDDILFGLRQSLKRYEHVSDLGISYGRNYNTYVGQGYAVLDIHQPENEGSCDSTEHVKRDCPKLKPRKISILNKKHDTHASSQQVILSPVTVVII